MKISRQKISFLMLLSVGYLLPFHFALADLSTPTGIVPCHDSPCTLCHLIIGVSNIVKFFLDIVITAAIVGITISGIMYTISAGTKMMETAKSYLKASIVGFAVAVGAWLIINVTLWLFGSDGSFGLSGKNWHTFTCDTSSTAGQGGSGSSTGASSSEKKCCVISKTKGEGDYGKKENCPDAKAGTTKAECESWCDSSEYKDNPEQLAACKSGCKDGEQTCEKGELTSNCAALEACGGGGSGNCAPTNNGCGGLGGNTNGCNNTSSELASKLACLKDKGVGASISSVTLNAHSDWCEKCVNSYAGSSYCSHSENSCHFGGRNCKGVSQAVDLNSSSAVAQAALSCGFDTVIWNGKELRTGKTASDHYDHVHASVNNSACGCDYQR